MLKNGIYVKTFRGKVPDGITNDHIRIYHIHKDVNVNSQIEWVKLEKGTKATDWRPAPEDFRIKLS